MAVTLTRKTLDNYEREIDKKYKQEKESIQTMKELFARIESGSKWDEFAAAGRGSTLSPLKTGDGAHTLTGKIQEVCEKYKNEQWTMRHAAHAHPSSQYRFPLEER